MGAKSLALLKHWDKLKVQDGIMYRETRDPVSKIKRLQLVLPMGLRDRALEGVHDLAGHQGQAITLYLARRFFWPNMERDVKDYVQCCDRCVLAKTPEPSARAPLESIKTSAPNELVCIDFWTAEDKTTSQRWLTPSPAETRLPNSCGSGCFVYMGSLNASTQTRAPALIVNWCLSCCNCQALTNHIPLHITPWAMVTQNASTEPLATIPPSWCQKQLATTDSHVNFCL